jgi:hypothetical protein
MNSKQLLKGCAPVARFRRDARAPSPSLDLRTEPRALVRMVPLVLVTRPAHE